MSTMMTACAVARPTGIVKLLHNSHQHLRFLLDRDLVPYTIADLLSQAVGQGHIV